VSDDFEGLVSTLCVSIPSHAWGYGKGPRADLWIGPHFNLHFEFWGHHTKYGQPGSVAGIKYGVPRIWISVSVSAGVGAAFCLSWSRMAAPWPVRWTIAVGSGEAKGCYGAVPQLC